MSESGKVTQVEEALRAQREAWQEISERVPRESAMDAPAQPPKRILIFGVGSSHFAARLAAYSLFRDKTRARLPVIACPSPWVGVEVQPTRGDWAIGISHRGKTGSTIEALRLSAREGAHTVLVCGKGAPRDESVAQALETVELEKVEPHTISMTGALCAITCFLGGRKLAEEWEAIRSIGTPNLDRLREYAGRGPSVLLGEWEGEWLAREGALKLMEMARVPARAYGSEEFFHGVRFSHKPTDKIWHVSVAGDAREGEIQAAHRVRVSGSSPLSWVPALVELQWLALATALNLGVDPDLV